MRKVSPLVKMIPPDIWNHVINSGDSEIDPEFPCFEENYFAIKNYIPKDFTIVDIGCYMAAQSYLFTEYTGYIGVDCYDSKECDGFAPPERFVTENSKHYSMTIKEFLESEEFSKLDLDTTYFVASYVPSLEETALMMSKARHALHVYCNDISAKGLYRTEIAGFVRKKQNDELREIRCQDCAYLIEDEYKSWICDDCGKDIRNIADEDCSGGRRW